ncbi:MAG: zinc ribbon domain-containing protein [Acutalibacteraceae bacterium]
MKKTREQSDKMKWYDFYVYIRFPLIFIFGFFGFVDNILTFFSIPKDIDNNIKEIIMIMSILQISRYILSIFTYKQMKNYNGYVMNNVLLLLELISSIIYALIQIMKYDIDSPNSAYFISSIAVGLLWTLSNFIYFYKRYDKTKMIFDSPASSKKYIKTKNIDNIDLSDIQNQEELVCKKCGAELNQNSKFCSSCGKKIKSKKIKDNKKFNKAIFISVSAVLLICLGVSITFNIIQNSELSQLQTKFEQQEKIKNDYISLCNKKTSQITKLQSRLYVLEDKSDFMDDYIEIVGVDKYYYHKYGCDYLDDSSFWAFNSEAAKSKGYHKCPHCH